MTTSHALKYNGAPYTAEGELQFPLDTSVTRGPGYAKCSCGALSPEALANGSQRRAWFKLHKAAPVAEQEEIPLDPEPVAEPEPVVDPEPVAEDAPEQEAPGDEQDSMEFSSVLPFTSESPASFWRYLGRDAVRLLADRGVLGPVLVATNANNRTLLVSGHSEADVDAAREIIEAYWSSALAAVKVWKKTDAEFLARPTQGLEGRKAAYELTGRFYLAHVDTFVQER